MPSKGAGALPPEDGTPEFFEQLLASIEIKPAAAVKKYAAALVAAGAIGRDIDELFTAEELQEDYGFKPLHVRRVASHRETRRAEAPEDDVDRSIAKLTGLKLSALIERARAAGVSQGALDEAGDEAAPKAAIVALILRAEASATATPVAVSPDTVIPVATTRCTVATSSPLPAAMAGGRGQRQSRGRLSPETKGTANRAAPAAASTQPTVLLDLSNIGHWQSRHAQQERVCWSWAQVRLAFDHYLDAGAQPLGIISPGTLRRNPMPPSFPHSKLVQDATGGAKDNDDRIAIMCAFDHRTEGYQLVTNDQFRDWDQSKIGPQIGAWLARSRQHVCIPYVFLGDGQSLLFCPERQVSLRNAGQVPKRGIVTAPTVKVRNLLLDLHFIVHGSGSKDLDGLRIHVALEHPGNLFLRDMRAEVDKVLRTRHASANRAASQSSADLELYDADGKHMPVDMQEQGRSKTLEGLGFYPGELVTVLVTNPQAGVSMEEDLTQLSSAHMAWARNKTERFRIQRFRATHATRTESDAALAALAATVYVITARASPQQRERLVAGMWRHSRNVPLCRTMYELLHQDKALTRSEHIGIAAGIMQILRSIPGAPKEDLLLETPALFSILMQERCSSVPFADVKLVDECRFAPYKGTRLRKPVRIEGLGDKVFSEDAAFSLAERDHAEEGEWQPATDVVRLLARNPGENTLSCSILRAKLRDAALADLSSLEPVMPSWRSLKQVPQRQRGPASIVSPLELKLPDSVKPALVFNEAGTLCVCDSSGATQTMKGKMEMPRAGVPKTLSIFHPAGSTDGLKTDVDADELAQSTQEYYQQLGLGGENVTEATMIVVDASESMMEEFRAPVEHTELDASTIETYQKTELFVRKLPFEATREDLEAVFLRVLRKGIKDIRMHRAGSDQKRAKGSFAGHATLVMTSVEEARRALRATESPIEITDLHELVKLRVMLASLGLDHYFLYLVQDRWDYDSAQAAEDSDWADMGISRADATMIRASWKPPSKGRPFSLQFLASNRDQRGGFQQSGGRGHGRGRGRGRAGGRRGGCFHCGAFDHKASTCPQRILQSQTQTSRMRTVQDGFEALSMRIMNLLQPLALGLLTFGDTVKVECELTDVLEDFTDDLEELTASGQTALWDGILTGMEKCVEYRNMLVAKGQKAPVLRIVALTDGVDNQSKRIQPAKLANALLLNGVILDCVLVGNMFDKQLPSMAKLTGGQVLIPESPLDAITKLESEAMLKVGWRPEIVVDKRLIGNFKKLEQLLRTTTADPQPVCEHVPVTSAVPSSSTLQEIVQGVQDTVYGDASSAPSSGIVGKSLSKTASKARNARILREFAQLSKDAGRDRVRHFMAGDQIDYWNVLLQGPGDSVYDGVFQLTIQFSARYPQEPPTVRFLPGTIKHVNIDTTTGRVCSQAFGSAYTSTNTVHDLLIAILSTLRDPNPDDAFNMKVALEYRADPEVFENVARFTTKTHASFTMDQLEAKLLGDSVEVVAAAPPVKKKHQLDCPGNHGLIEELCPNAEYYCSVCSEEIRVGAQWLACEKCEFDLCESCVAKGHDAPDKSRCSLTGKPLVDGVVTQFGIVYERSVLLGYLKENDMLDYPIDPVMSQKNADDDGKTFPLSECCTTTVDEEGTVYTDVDLSKLKDFDPDEKSREARHAIPQAMEELILMETARSSDDDDGQSGTEDEDEDGQSVDSDSSDDMSSMDVGSLSVPIHCFMCAKAGVFVSCPTCQVAVYCSDECKRDHMDVHQHHCMQRPTLAMKADDPEEVAQLCFESAERKTSDAKKLQLLTKALAELRRIHPAEVFEDTQVNYNIKSSLRHMYFEALKGLAKASAGCAKHRDAYSWIECYQRASGDILNDDMRAVEKICDEQAQKEEERAAEECERAHDRAEQEARKGLPAGWVAVVSEGRSTPFGGVGGAPSVQYHPILDKTALQADRPTQRYELIGRLAKIVGLETAAHLNGQVVTITGFVRQTQRYTVAPIGVTAWDPVKVRLERLVPVRDSEVLSLVREIADPDHAITVCDRALKFHAAAGGSLHDRYNLHNIVGLKYKALGDLTAAICSHTDAIRLALELQSWQQLPKNMTVLYANRARAYDEAGCVQDAVDDFRSALSANPAHDDSKTKYRARIEQLEDELAAEARVEALEKAEKQKALRAKLQHAKKTRGKGRR
jgi:ubiquitin-protein ligase/tetratricopeptide (TPR) repeat protein